MIERGYSKFYWGFIFVMLNFRIQGFDILPDIVGYLFFASGFRELSLNSPYFSTASTYNIPMIILSVFSIFQAPANGSGINFGPFGALGIFIMIGGFILNLLVIYNLFKGIMDMAEKVEQYDLAQEAERRWTQYLMLQLAFFVALILIFIPPLAFAFFIGIFVAAIILTMHIVSFMKRCGNSFNTQD